MAGGFHGNGVHRLSSCNEQGFAVGADEGDVSGLFGEGDYTKNLSFRADNLNTQAAGDVQVAPRVNG